MKEQISTSESQSSVIAVSPKHQAWRESVVLARASGPIRNRTAYLRAAMPAFVADEQHEIGQWLVARLVEYIDSEHPTVNGMKIFLKRTAENHDLPVPDDQIEAVVEIGYYKWKSKIVLSTGEATALRK